MSGSKKLPQTIELEKLGMESRQANYIGGELYKLNERLDTLIDLFNILNRTTEDGFIILDNELKKIKKKL